MIIRNSERFILSLLGEFPAVAILGPRQVGKTTLAKAITKHINPKPLYIDLEKPSDFAKFSEPELYLQANSDRLVIIDEIQKMPGLFQLLRSLIDERRNKGFKAQQFLLLGSASKELLQQTSESLAGRIIYTELSGFTASEVPNANLLWLRGGFPDSYLSASDNSSMNWRQSFITTYLERDIPQMGYKVPATTLRRFWTMIASNQGELLNISRFAGNLGASVPTISRYLDLLVDLFLVRLLRPWASNFGKRLVKVPKLYIRDSGLSHALLNIKSYDDLLSSYVIGRSFEGFVIENILSSVSSSASAWFYRTSAGAEIDLLLEVGGRLTAIEIKRSLNPVVSKGFYNAIVDLKPEKSYIVYPGNERYHITQNVEVIPLPILLQELACS